MPNSYIILELLFAVICVSFSVINSADSYNQETQKKIVECCDKNIKNAYYKVCSHDEMLSQHDKAADQMAEAGILDTENVNATERAALRKTWADELSKNYNDNLNYEKCTTNAQDFSSCCKGKGMSEYVECSFRVLPINYSTFPVIALLPSATAQRRWSSSSVGRPTSCWTNH